MLFTRILRTTSGSKKFSGQTVNGPGGRGRRYRGKARTVALTGVSALSMIAGAGVASAGGASMSAAPADVDVPPGPGDWSCDDKTWDGWFPGDIAPGNLTYNPTGKYSTTQMSQYHVGAEDTFAEARTERKGTYLYVEDKKSGQKCPSQDNLIPDGYTNTVTTSTNGYLDNRNTSVRTCLVEPQMDKPKCGAWYREDSGGHRQLDFRGLEKLDYKLDPGATASYDDHARSTGGAFRPGYGIDFGGSKEEANLYVQRTSPGLAYGGLKTSNKNVEIRIDSDKYGKGDWVKPNKDADFPETFTGVLYNDNDNLRIVVREPNGDVHKGKWHTGNGV